MSARVPVADPRRAAFAQQNELSAIMARFVESGRYILGPECSAFEAELAAYLEVGRCVGLASGTDALELALLSTGCGAGDVVLAAANCGGYAATAARRAGLAVRYADIDPETLSLSPATVAAALEGEVRAVVVTHLYGLLSDIEAIVALCHERGVVVVEDCAQAAGARRDGRMAGAFGDVATFSFYPTKNLAALGDGGALVTNNDGIADRALLLRQYGWDAKYRVSVLHGGNSRLDELQAAILRTRLGRLDEANEGRRTIVRRYAEALPPAAGRLVQLAGEDFVAHLAVVLAEDRDGLRAALEADGIGTDVHYPIPDHWQPAWRTDYEEVSLPATEHAASHVLTLPCFPELTTGEVDRVCEVLRAA